MSVSAGPYNRLIPFVGTDEVLVNQDSTSDNLEITLQISNEIGQLSNKIIKFGNFVYLTADAKEATELCTDPRKLIEMISEPAKENKFMFSLSAKDFETKQISIGPRGSLQHIHAQNHRTTLTIDNTPDLYLVVAAFRVYKNRISIGNVIRETLLRKKKTPTTLTLYRLAESVPGYGLEGSIWPGSVHKSGKKLMAGNIHISKKHPTLRAETVPNIKIKDMRILQAAANVAPSYSAVKMGVPCVSALEISRGSLGMANGMFSFDMLNFMRINSALSGIMTNQDSILESSVLDDVIIYQKKSGLNLKGNSLTPVPVLSCGLGKVNGFKKVASLNDGCEVLDTANNGAAIQDISFIDATIKGMQTGFAEYKVEILVSDKSKETIQGLVRKLDLYAKQAREKMIDSSTDTFDFSLASALERMIDLYLRSLEYLYGEKIFGATTMGYWRDNLVATTYDTPGSSRGKMNILKIVEDYTKDLNALIQKTGRSTSSSANFRSVMGMKKNDTVLTHRHTFANKLEIQGPASVGMGYIDDIIPDQKAITPQISFDSYNTRAVAEVNKYNISNPESKKVNKYGFLSPSFVGLGKKNIINTKVLIPDSSKFLPLVRSRLGTEPSQNNKPKNDDALNKLQILQDSGVAVIPLKVSLKKEVIAPSVTNPTTTPASGYLSRSSKFYLQNLQALPNIGSQKSIVRRKGRKDLTKSPLVDKLINSTITNFKPQKEVKNTNLINGSVALAKTEEDSAIVAKSDSMTAIVNYGSMTQVQYLEPYKESEGIKKQNWKILDNYTFENAQKDKTPLICRVVKVTNTVAANQKLGMKPLSSLFTLGDVKTKKPKKSHLIEKVGPAATTASLVAGYGEEILYSKNVPLSKSSKPLRETHKALDIMEASPPKARAPKVRQKTTRTRRLRSEKGLGY